MASRILGMGDVLTLIEKAEAAADEDEQARLEQQMMAGEFSFDDLLTSYRMLKRMGSMKSVLGMIPGLGKQLQGLEINEKDMGRVEAIVLSMTPRERRMPHLIDLSRRRRIAARQRHDARAGQPADERPQADAEDDEGRQQGEDAVAAARDGPGGNGAALGTPGLGGPPAGRPGRGKRKKKRSKR